MRGYELDTILSSTVPMWFGLNPRGSLENYGQAWGVFSPTKQVCSPGDGFCAGLAALERQIVGADLSPADFRFLICLDDLH